MDFETMIKALGGKIGIELAPDAEGVCQLAVDDMQVVVQQLPELQVVCVFAEIGEPPPENPTALYEAALAANHLFQGTSGATISREADTGKLFLCRCDPLPLLDADSFSAVLEKFVNTLETWRKLVAEYRPVADAGVKSAAEQEMPAFGGSFMQV